jgi:hypothetical protein
VGEFSVDDVA